MKLYLEVEIPETLEAIDDLFAYLKIKKEFPTTINGTNIALTGIVVDKGHWQQDKERLIKEL